MRVFVCTDFKGHYPVGTSAVVIAASEEDAKVMLLAELSDIGLKQEDEDIALSQIKTRKPQVIILCNGDY